MVERTEAEDVSPERWCSKASVRFVHRLAATSNKVRSTSVVEIVQAKLRVGGGIGAHGEGWVVLSPHGVIHKGYPHASIRAVSGRQRRRFVTVTIEGVSTKPNDSMTGPSNHSVVVVPQISIQKKSIETQLISRAFTYYLQNFHWLEKMLGVIVATYAQLILPEFKNAQCNFTSPLDTRLASVESFKSDDAKQIIRELERQEIRNHRKQWEFVYVVQALRHAGMLVPGRKALVFAAGQEPLISYFASKGVHVLATDMDVRDAKKKGWVQSNQHSASRDQLYRPWMLSKEDFDQRVRFQTMDMNSIDSSMYGGFDFVWSTCSLEHVGSIALGKLFALKSALLLKRGGIAVHTTEFTLSSSVDTVDKGPTVLWRRSDVEELRADLRGFGFDVQNMCLASGSDPVDQMVDLPPFRSHNHMRLRLGQHIATSVAWTARRAS